VAVAVFDSKKDSGKNYLTPEGLQQLRGELQVLLEVERPRMVHMVSVAAAMGDRSENAEYIYGKRRLREIDRRIRFLQGRLENVETVDVARLSLSRVAFGLWVHVADEDGKKSYFRIVGPDEINPQQGWITFTSPLGRSLLGREVGETVLCVAPKGTVEYEILEISNTAPV
jgi:transcription elongation factor GreB